MSYLILSINAGSSSLKTSLYQAFPEKGNIRRLANVEVSNINQPPSTLRYNHGETKIPDVRDHKQAFEKVLDTFLSDENVPELKKKEDIHYACHRVVHGGNFKDDQLITRETFHKIEKLSDLAPLHNASAVSLMIACHDYLPKVTNVACFDSRFHQSIPKHISSYMIDQHVADREGLRKYGFHGLSYDYITQAVAVHEQKSIDQTSIIALHLGSGASACAIKNGKSIDTTMGFTPVSGLPGATRSGDIDPSLIFHYTTDASKLSPSNLHISQAEEILNKQSGWKALTGTTDFAEIAQPGAPDTHKLALDIFVDRIIGYIGSYYVKIGGQLDALVFAGGIGEKSDLLRSRVTEAVNCLGFKLEETKNAQYANGIADISANNSKYKVLVCETDEDYQMAFNTMRHSA